MKKKIFFSLAVFLLVFSAVSIVKASGNVTGWLWGGNSGIITATTNLGWISMNSVNCDADGNGFSDGVGACPAAGTAISDYGVTIPAGVGNVAGYAWSENLGWIDFSPAGPYPAVPNNSVARNGNNLEGWARIVSIAEASAIGNSGGWEGWISMSGATYGVDVAKMDGTGANPTYAWSDELGWIDFSWASMGPVVPPAKSLKVCAGGCDGGGIALTTINMNENTTRNLRACYNAASDCSDATGDVTGDAATAWAEASAVINLAYIAPNEELSAGGVGADSVEGFSVAHDGHTVNVTVNVIDVPAGAICGNGAIEGAEACDDGVANGDCSVAGVSCSDNSDGVTPECTLCSTGPNWREVAP